MVEGPAAERFSDDLAWIVGNLEWNEFEGGFWSLHFGEDDAPHGGRVVLGRPGALQGFQDGEQVRVEGRPREDRITFFMAGTPYELTGVERVTKG